MHPEEGRPTFRLAGVGVRVRLSGLVLAVLIGLSLYGRFVADEGTSTAVFLAVLGGLCFLLSILAHEMGHAVEARHRDMEVTGVTLFLLGGVTSMRGRVRGPRDEFAIAAVGPFVSLLLAAILGTAVTVIQNLGLGSLARVADVLGMLGWLNLALAVFNSIPGAPLDGGRMLRAVLWKLLGDRERAARAAARVGQLVALSLGLFGLAQLRGGGVGGFDGLWALFLAVFMWQAASSEHRTSRAGEQLRSRMVASLPTPPTTMTLDADWSVEQALLHLDPDAPDHEVHVAARGDAGGWEAVGALDVAALRRLDPHDRAIRRVGDVSVAFEAVPEVDDRRTVADLVDVLQDHPFAVTRDVSGAPHVWSLHRVVDALEQRVPA